MSSTDYYIYLAHHGIDGQKWGKKNGPPYPLEPGDHSPAERRQNPGLNTLKGEKTKKKKKFKPQKGVVRNKKTGQFTRKRTLGQKAKEYVRAKLRGELTEKEKNNVILKGDIATAQKHYKQFSREDIDKIVDRNYGSKKLSDTKIRNDAAFGGEKVQQYIKTMNTIKDIMEPTIKVGKAAVEAYNIGVGIYNTFNPDDQKRYIFTGGKNKDKEQKGNN